jgi:hypothetical protein
VQVLFAVPATWTVASEVLVRDMASSDLTAAMPG